MICFAYSEDHHTNTGIHKTDVVHRRVEETGHDHVNTQTTIYFKKLLLPDELIANQCQ